MFGHVLSVLVLAVYGFETYRTIQRFGLTHSGMTGMILNNPLLHAVGGGLFGVGFALVWRLGWGASYLGPGGVLISLVYAGAALWEWHRRDDGDEGAEAR